jgi:hypothetical protein
MRAGFQLLTIIRSEGKGASQSKLNVKRVAQMLPLGAALGRSSYWSRRLAPNPAAGADLQGKFFCGWFSRRVL